MTFPSFPLGYTPMTDTEIAVSLAEAKVQAAFDRRVEDALRGIHSPEAHQKLREHFAELRGLRKQLREIDHSPEIMTIHDHGVIRKQYAPS